MTWVALLIFCIILMPLSIYLEYKAALPMIKENPLIGLTFAGLFALPFIFAGWSIYQLNTDVESKKL